MGLSDMKKMVEQGEQLYEERKNKDLTRAVDLVDAAEEVQDGAYYIIVVTRVILSIQAVFLL